MLDSCAWESAWRGGRLQRRISRLPNVWLKRVVIDVRQNGGGDSPVIGPLKSGLASRLKAIGPAYVLIGRGTFSSGMLNAIELRESLHASW